MNKQFHCTGGSVLWLTGLSGSGKSTLTAGIQQRLIEQGEHPLILDGDLVRAAVEDPHWGFDAKSRLMGSFRYAKLASLAASQGLTVIVPTISLYHQVHSWNRLHIPGYFEVYLETSEDTRRQRDPKVLYKNHQNGDKTEMAGLDHAIETPLNPDLVIDNNGGVDDIPRVVDLITQRFLASRK